MAKQKPLEKIEEFIHDALDKGLKIAHIKKQLEPHYPQEQINSSLHSVIKKRNPFRNEKITVPKIPEKYQDYVPLAAIGIIAAIGIFLLIMFVITLNSKLDIYVEATIEEDQIFADETINLNIDIKNFGSYAGSDVKITCTIEGTGISATKIVKLGEETRTEMQLEIPKNLLDRDYKLTVDVIHAKGSEYDSIDIHVNKPKAYYEEQIRLRDEALAALQNKTNETKINITTGTQANETIGTNETTPEIIDGQNNQTTEIINDTTKINETTINDTTTTNNQTNITIGTEEPEPTDTPTTNETTVTPPKEGTLEERLEDQKLLRDAKESGDPDKCYFITNSETRERCYSFIAEKIKDHTICEKIDTQEKKDVCYTPFGGLEEGICDKIIDSGHKRTCLEMEAHNK